MSRRCNQVLINTPETQAIRSVDESPKCANCLLCNAAAIPHACSCHLLSLRLVCLATALPGCLPEAEADMDGHSANTHGVQR